MQNYCRKQKVSIEFEYLDEIDTKNIREGWLGLPTSAHTQKSQAAVPLNSPSDFASSCATSKPSF
jgi:hypothetical protein